MHRLLLPVLLFLLVAAPAAARQWQAPVPGVVASDVAADGTSVSATLTVPAGATAGELKAQVANGAAATLTQAAGRALAGAGSAGQAVVAWQEGADVKAAFALNATFGTPVTLGTGTLLGVDMNADGDAVVAFDSAGQVAAVARPSGGSPSAAATLPSGTFAGVALLTGGDALVASSGAAGLAVYGLSPAGAVSGPVTLAGDGGTGAIAADGTGRAVAAWSASNRTVLNTAVRAPDDTWSAPAPLPIVAPVHTVTAAAGANGDAVIAWRHPGLPLAEGSYGGPVLASAGTLASGAFSSPVLIERETSGFGPVAEVAPNGTAVVAYTDAPTQAARAARREGTGAFAPPQTVACGPSVQAGGIDLAGSARLIVGGALVADAPGDAAAPVCRVPETGSTGQLPVYNVNPIVVDEFVVIDARGIRLPDHDLQGAVFSFDPGKADADAIVRHTFKTPGLHEYTIDSAQIRRFDGVGVPVSKTLTVDVFARPELEVLKVTRTAVRVRANAFAGAEPHRVRLQVKGRGGTVGRRSVALSGLPKRVNIPLQGAKRGRIIVYLRDGQTRRRETARIR